MLKQAVMYIVLALCCRLVLGQQSQYTTVVSADDQPQGVPLNNLILNHRRMALFKGLYGDFKLPKNDQGDPRKPNKTTQFEGREIPYLDLRIHRPFDLTEVMQRLIEDIIASHVQAVNYQNMKENLRAASKIAQ